MIDMAKAMEIAGGDRELLNELASIFLRDYPLRLAALKKAIRECDCKSVEFEGHTIKGSAMTIAAGQVRDIAYELEKMGASGELSGAGEALEKLEAMLELADLELNKLIRDSNSDV